MQHASLTAFLTGELSAEAFAEEIASETAAFNEALRETGHGFIVVSEGPNFVLTKDGARRLLQAVLNEQLPSCTAVYIADCIQASKHIDFADQVTRDAIFFVEDDHGRFIEGRDTPWTRDDILNELALLE
ncbi:MAG: hypothetical protein ACO1O3_05855 [Sphingobium sp.]